MDRALYSIEEARARLGGVHVRERHAHPIERWRFFKKGVGADPGEDYFANHCPHCDAMQEDYLLHAEPGDVFFGIAHTELRTVEFTPLVGRVQLSGDYSF